MSKETYFFSHDYNARSDEKIKSLMRKHGWTGYGLFWGIVEDLYNNSNMMELDYENLSYDYRVEIKLLTSVIKDFGLFVIHGTKFNSKSIEYRLNERKEKSESARKSANARWKKEKEPSEPEKEFVAPTQLEVSEYFKENGYKSEIAKKAYEYYSEKDWVDGKGNKVKNWKLKIQSVWFKPENKKVDKSNEMVY